MADIRKLFIVRNLGGETIVSMYLLVDPFVICAIKEYLLSTLCIGKNVQRLVASNRSSTRDVSVQDILASPSDAEELTLIRMRYAAKSGREMLESILTAAANVGIAVDDLLRNHADPNYQNPRTKQTALSEAARGGFLHVARSLVAECAEVNKLGFRGGSPLYWAASSGNKEVVHFLLVARSEVNTTNKKGSSPLLHSIFPHVRPDIVQLLCRSSADVNKRNNIGMNPLLCVSAAKHQTLGAISAARHLCKAKADLDIKNRSGRNTPLGRASRVNFFAMVKLLCELRAQVDVKDCFGRTPLATLSFMPSQQSCELTLNYLLRKTADVNSKDCEGGTPLMRAAALGRRGWPQTIPLLLQAKADVHSQDGHLRTPLFWAAHSSCSHDGLIRLLQQRAQVSVKDNLGRTPLTVAARNFSFETARILLNAKNQEEREACDAKRRRRGLPPSVAGVA